jgi:hypothetical protein
MVVRWMPEEVLPLLQQSYIILSRRFARAPERAA